MRQVPLSPGIEVSMKKNFTCKSGQGLAQRGLVARLGMTAGSKDVFHYGFAGYQPVNPNTNLT